LFLGNIDAQKAKFARAITPRPRGFGHQARNASFRSLLGKASRTQVKAPFFFISRAPFMKAASASRDSAPPTLNRLTPTASISAAVSAGSAALITTLIGLDTAEATSFMVARSRSPGA